MERISSQEFSIFIFGGVIVGEKRVVACIEKTRKKRCECWGIQLSEVQEQIIRHTLKITNESHLRTLEKYADKLKQAERPH